MKIRQIKYQVVIIITLGVYLYYLVYRLRYTINSDSLLLSLSFFYAEVHGFIALFLFFFQIWSPAERKSTPPPAGLSVDIYIPTYNEDISIVRKTALSCVNIRYPHKTYILDDGNRPELAKEAAEWGCGYITRTERMGAKAGNLNHALHRTNGEFVAIFDADFVPQPDFLDKTMGYFRDQKTAFVQTPQNYYNVDVFQFRVNREKEKSWNEQDIFYKLMMPCIDYWNSTFFIGTAAVFRKKALEEIGGFVTGSVTEDFHTSIQFYARGWKGIYHNEILANGLAAKDLKNYHTQKLRWAEGNIGLFFKDNPFFVKGLTIPQRICFFAAIFGWLVGFPKLIYFIMPPVMILIGGYPIGSFDNAFIWRYLMFLFTIIFGFKYASRGYGKIRYAEGYNMMNFFILIRAAMRAVFKKLFRLRSRFIVTGKGNHEFVNISNIIPQLLMGLLCFTGVVWGSLKLYYGVTTDFVGIGTAIFWSGINGFLALFTIENVTRPYFKRKEFRFIGTMPVRYSMLEDSGSVSGIGISKDINEHGISLVTFNPLPIDKKISLSIYLNERILPCRATVLYTVHAHHLPHYLYGKMFVYGIKFDELGRNEMDLISAYCFNTIIPRYLHKFGERSSVLLKMFFKFYKHERFRKHVRRKITLPLVVQNNGKPSLAAVTNDISISGLSFTSYVPLESGAILVMEIFTPFGTLVAEGEIKQMRAIGAEDSYFIGVKFTQFFDQSEGVFSDRTGKNRQESLSRWLKITSEGSN
ncbi:MAG: glycosyltransferase [Candidatus Brocadia sp.]|nr:glycosyltransferase [Candidatus Brocadia sp.]